jgi:hypothetical protein
VDRPLILAGWVKAIKGKIGSFADAHAGVAKQQEHVGAQVVSGAVLAGVIDPAGL